MLYNIGDMEIIDIEPRGPSEGARAVAAKWAGVAASVPGMDRVSAAAAAATATSRLRAGESEADRTGERRWTGGAVLGIEPEASGKDSLLYRCLPVHPEFADAPQLFQQKVGEYMDRLEGELINARAEGASEGIIGPKLRQYQSLETMRPGDRFNAHFTGGHVVHLEKVDAKLCEGAECPPCETKKGCVRWWWLVALGLGGVYIGSRRR